MLIGPYVERYRLLIRAKPYALVLVPAASHPQRLRSAVSEDTTATTR